MIKVTCVRYIVAVVMIWCLNKRVVLLPPKIGELRFGDYIKSGIFPLAFSFKISLLFYFFNQCQQF